MKNERFLKTREAAANVNVPRALSNYIKPLDVVSIDEISVPENGLLVVRLKKNSHGAANAVMNGINDIVQSRPELSDRVIVVSDSVEFESLDESDMNRYGWVKKDRN